MKLVILLDSQVIYIFMPWEDLRSYYMWLYIQLLYIYLRKPAQLEAQEISFREGKQENKESGQFWSFLVFPHEFIKSEMF